VIVSYTITADVALHKKSCPDLSARRQQSVVQGPADPSTTPCDAHHQLRQGKRSVPGLGDLVVWQCGQQPVPPSGVWLQRETVGVPHQLVTLLGSDQIPAGRLHVTGQLSPVPVLGEELSRLSVGVYLLLQGDEVANDARGCAGVEP